MDSEYNFSSLFRRLRWDLMDTNERKYYLYWFLCQIPGLFGDRLRARFVAKRIKSVGENFLVLAGTRFRTMENLVIGDNVTLGYDNFIQALGGVTIGNNVLCGPGVKIWSVNHNYQKKSVLIRDQGQSLKPVVLGDDIWLGSNAFITPGVILPQGAVVAANAMVTAKHYKPYCIVAGNPGRVIGYRSDEDNEK